MSDRRSNTTSTLLFGHPREALGWLVNHWSGLVIASIVMAWLLQAWLIDVELPIWSQLALVGSLLVLSGLNVWAYVVSSSARPRLREEVRQRPLWGRDRFVNEHAAARLGWPTPAVVWTGRLLLLVAVVVTSITVVAAIRL